MNVRVIAGKYGGRILDAPDRSSTHAMSERGRNAIFNSLGDKTIDAEVLDAFAGSGSIGIEALSRGAKSVIFLEKDRVASSTIRRNIMMLDASSQMKVVKAGVASWIETQQGTYDLIFADPPYHDPQLSTVHKLFGLLKPGGLMLLSHPGSSEVLVQNGIVVVDNRSYGNLHLTVFRRDLPS